ncbi:hypothetical protein CCACVL1_26690 [Corchorus capsularis]|uniref:Uncharacterized protein n=1 Tax=Corchorus capsularis TaxID=210143 RepID=A0A1R3GDU4_COCAP|nr:hypothetical protein CCACVL1_26690 [Corchorus capsularis]
MSRQTSLLALLAVFGVHMETKLFPFALSPLAVTFKFQP